jgi:hypothetical protein
MNEFMDSKIIRLLATKNFVEPESYDVVVTHRLKTVKTFHFEKEHNSLGTWNMHLD